MRRLLWQRIVPLCLFAILATSIGIESRGDDEHDADHASAPHDDSAGHADAGHNAAAHGDEHGDAGHHPDTSQPPIEPNRQMAELFVFSLVFFCLYLVVAKKFAWLPLIGGLDAREARVNRALAEAEAARMEATKLLADHQKHLDEVTEEVKAIIAKARTDAEQEKLRIVEEAEAETTAMRDRAIADIYAAREQALTGLDEQIESQVAAATEHVLG
jgi:F-type H+-transporting ATPase subunit b